MHKNVFLFKLILILLILHFFFFQKKIHIKNEKILILKKMVISNINLDRILLV